MTVMSGVTAQAGVGSRVGREQVLRLALAVLLLGGWVTWAATTYPSQLRIVSADTFRQDLAAGHVVAFRAVSNVRHDRVWPPDGSPDQVDLPATNEDGTPDRADGVSDGPPPTVAYWTDAAVGPVRVLDANDPRSPSAEMAIMQLRDAGVPPAGVANHWPGDRADVWGLLTGALTLLVIVFGPVPTRGTRWFWFWVTGVPWGLGVVAYAVLELVRPRPDVHVGDGAEAAEPATEGAPGATHQLGHRSDGRIRGGKGLLLALVVGIVLAVLGSLLSQAVGGVWVPLP
jgi:hypothetical protein